MKIVARLSPTSPGTEESPLGMWTPFSTLTSAPTKWTVHSPKQATPWMRRVRSKCTVTNLHGMLRPSLFRRMTSTFQEPALASVQLSSPCPEPGKSAVSIDLRPQPNASFEFVASPKRCKTGSAHFVTPSAKTYRRHLCGLSAKQILRPPT